MMQKLNRYFWLSRRIIVFFTVILFFAAGQKSSAFMGIGGAKAPTGPASFAIGCCEAGCVSSGPMLTPTGVDMADTWLDDIMVYQFEAAGEAISQSQKRMLGTINSSFDVQNHTYRDLIAGYEYSDQKIKNFDNYSRISSLYSLDTVCGKQKNACIGESVKNELDNHLRADIKDYSHNYTLLNELRQRYEKQKFEDIDSQYFFPANKTISENQISNTRALIKSMINPMPALEIEGPDNERSQEYKNLRKLKESYLSVVSAVFDEIVSGYVPSVYMAELGQSMYEEMGMTGKPPQMTDDGKMSYIGYLDFMIDFRYANDEWRVGETGIHSKTRAGLLRELARIKSLELAIDRMITRRTQHLMTMLALNQAFAVATKDSADLRDMLKEILN